MSILRKMLAGAAVVTILGIGTAQAADACCGGAADSKCATTATDGKCALPTAAAAATSEATPAPVKAQTICPIMDSPINKKFFADYEGKRVYFCCGRCPGKFKKDPAKYVKQLEDAGVTLEKTPAPAK